MITLCTIIIIIIITIVTQKYLVKSSISTYEKRNCVFVYSAKLLYFDFKMLNALTRKQLSFYNITKIIICVEIPVVRKFTVMHKKAILFSTRK